MFDVERFVADCRAARAEDPTHKAVREVLARAVADPGAVLQALGAPLRAEIRKLYHSPELTILNVIWGAHMTFYPHNHGMWGVIGIYTGREDNIFWRRLPGGRVEAAGARALCERDAVPLGAEIIHSVTNPIPRLRAQSTCTAETSSPLGAGTLLEQRCESQNTLRYFEEWNRRNTGRSVSTT